MIDALTTSNHGSNIVARFQAVAHFFLEGNNFTQQQQQSFGARSATIFSTSSTLSIQTAKQIYAICQGQVLLQPQQGNNAKVNLILRPFRQPINGMPIKYFIYRGLDKSNFINDQDHTVAAKSTTPFTEFITTEFERFYKEEAPDYPEFSASYLGMPQNPGDQHEVELIDHYFFKVTEVIDADTGEENPRFAYELPIVPRGMAFGTVSGEISIDVVLHRGDFYTENDQHPFQLNLAFARAQKGFLDTNTVSDPFKKKLLKEAATQFIDLAAFYGLFTSGTGKLYYDGSTMPLTAMADIYAKLAGFYTKSLLYLYVQSNRQRSYNFYGNYSHGDSQPVDLKVGTDPENMQEGQFGTLGWPIHEISALPDPVSNGRTTLCLQFTTDNHAKAVLYAKIGFIVSGHQNNFVCRDDLLAVPTAGSGPPTAPPYTLPLIFETPASGGSTIVNILQLLYEGNELFAEDPAGGNSNPGSEVPRQRIKDMDRLYGSLHGVPFSTFDSGQHYPVLSEVLPNLTNIPAAIGKSTDTALLRTKWIEDIAVNADDNTKLERITFETLIDDFSRSSWYNSSAPTVDSERLAVSWSPDQNTGPYQPQFPYYLQLNRFSVQSESLKGITMDQLGRKTPVKRMLGITKAELQILQELISDHQLVNERIFFEDTLLTEDQFFESPEQLNYKRFHLHLVAENDLGALQLYRPDLTIEVFTLDGLCFFSKDYTRYLMEQEKNEPRPILMIQ